MRLVLDTNVVLSGLLWTGSPMRILAAAQAGEAELFTSRALLAELHRCLARAKFARQLAVSGIGREELFLGYVELATALAPEPIAPVILADPAEESSYLERSIVLRNSTGARILVRPSLRSCNRCLASPVTRKSAAPAFAIASR